jgi:hypothetical protein
MLDTIRFSSEAGGALNFFAYFLVSRQESKWGLGQSPINSKWWRKEN